MGNTWKNLVPKLQSVSRNHSLQMGELYGNIPRSPRSPCFRLVKYVFVSLTCTYRYLDLTVSNSVLMQIIYIYIVLVIYIYYIYMHTTKKKNETWLVVWNMFLGISSSLTDFHIFQRGWNHQPETLIISPSPSDRREVRLSALDALDSRESRAAGELQARLHVHSNTNMINGNFRSLIYGRYLQFRFLKWPRIWCYGWSNNSNTNVIL